MALPEWTQKTGTVIAEIEERTNVSIPLPLASTVGVTVSVIAGELPPGLRISGTNIEGVAFEVPRSKEFEFVVRASTAEGILDRTFVIRVDGEDAPVWETPEGALNLNTTLRNQYWIDIRNSAWGIYTISESTGLFENKTIEVVETIPAQTTGTAGDIVFVTTREQFWFKASNRWVKLSSNELKGVLGPDTDIIVSKSAPSAVDYDFWWNLQKSNNGLAINLKFYDENVPVWKPVDYFVGPTPPIAPFDNQVWIQTSETAFEYVIKIYDQTESIWNVLNPIYDTTPPDRVNKAYFVLDSSPVDFQLQALDSDLRAGEELYYYIADGDGTLPPGLTLDTNGRISGVVDPLLALDIDAQPGYDVGDYDSNIFDYLVVDDNGYDSFFYDTTFYGFSSVTRRPKKLNRTYTFTVTVEDDVSSASREFTIYVVGDDFLRADNTIMKSGTGIFTADATFLRKPIFLTPGNFGYRRANNYQTLFIEVFDPNTILGELSYSIKDYNDDGTESVIPPGMVLDGLTGEIAGTVPYQPAVEKEYKFTIEALRQDVDTNDIVEVNANIQNDTISGSTSLKINKLPTTTDDGVDDLRSFVESDITIDNIIYTVSSVNGDNVDYDVLNLDRPLEPTPKSSPITLWRDASIGQEYIYIKNLDQKSINFWHNKLLIFSDSEKYKFLNTINTDDVFKSYIEYTITSDDSAEGLDWNYDGSGITPAPGDTLESLLIQYITTILNYGSTDYEIYSVQDKEIKFAIVADSVTRNRNTFKEALSTTDSAYDTVTIEKSEEFIRVPLSEALQRNLIKNQQYALGAVKDTLITNKLSVTNVGTIAAVKTFTVTILGEVDSTINWLTDADLGSINANRTSYLFLEAQTTLVGSNLRYDIIEGTLPRGLELRRNGEIVGRAEQYGTNGLTYIDQGQAIWTAGTSYEIGNVVQLGDDLYKAITDHTATIDNSPIGTDSAANWQSLSQRTTFDGGNTSFDRKYVFKVMARDRFGYSASIKEFTLVVNDSDTKLYSNVYMQPYPKTSQKTLFTNFVNNYKIFDPAYIYRPSDPNFGVRKDLRTLAYAGIEQKSIHNFMAAVARNHKKKQFYFGDLKTAVAKLPGTDEVLYEVVYVEIIDPQEPANGELPVEIKTRNAQRLTVNDVKLETKDDVTAQEVGQDIFVISLRSGEQAKFNANSGSFLITTRSGNVDVDTVEGRIPVVDREGIVILVRSISLTTDNSGDAYRFRPRSAPITADSQGFKASQTQNVRRFVSNIGNMRKRIEEIGANEREFLPLWMRSSQETATQEIDYVTAMVLCYCKPGTSNIIKENITQSGFTFNQINYEIDRYIVDGTAEQSQEQFLLFANYKFNV